jgi:hypothetical protein
MMTALRIHHIKMENEMTNEQMAQNILRFYTEKRIKLECQMRGEQFDNDKFEQSFQTMLISDEGQSLVNKIMQSNEMEF